MQWQLIFTDQYRRRALNFIKRHPDGIVQNAKTFRVASDQSPSPLAQIARIEGEACTAFQSILNIALQWKCL